MARSFSLAFLLIAALSAQSFAQEVFVARDTSTKAAVAARIEKEKQAREQLEEELPKVEPVKEQVAKAVPTNPPPAKQDPVVAIAKPAPAAAKPQPAQTVKAPPPPAAKPEPVVAQAPKPQPAKSQPPVVETMKAQPLKVALQQLTQPSKTLGGSSFETAFTKLADGFDFPIGKPDADGYYKARGFRSKGHLGEDWDGVRGGDTDLGDPIYSIGDGVVVFARDCHMGWGNVVIVRHAFREGGEVKHIDALYGHLNTIGVKRGQAVARGQLIGTMGTAHGLYDAHLHLEIRKNLEIGMSRAKFARDFSNYYDPSQFIAARRHLQNSDGRYKIAMNTFTYDSKINWATKRNYSSYRGGSSESAANLKRALAAKKN